MIGGNDFSSWWGFPEAQDMLVQIVARAIKHGGFHVVLMQPDDTWPACTATDTAIKRGHVCKATDDHSEIIDVLAPDPERPQRIKPMVTAAVARVTERYGGIPNVGIDLHPSGYSITDPTDMPATLEGPFRAWLQSGTGGQGGIVPVPPTVLGGQAVRVWSTHDRDAGS